MIRLTNVSILHYRSVCFLALYSALFMSQAQAHQSPRGLVEINWPMKHIARTLSAGYPDSLGLYALPRRGLPEVKEVEGRRCLTGSFFAFDVDDSFAFDIDEDVELELLLDRNTTGTFLYSYDRNGNAEAVDRVAVPADAGADGRWHREVIKLERARFANRGMGQSDIALVAIGAQIPVAEDPTNTLTVCSVALKRSYQTIAPKQLGFLDLEILDQATGQPTPARMGLYDSTGRMPLPSDDALIIKSYNDPVKQIFLRSNFGPGQPWPASNRYVFYVDGRYRAELPAGTYNLVVAKGLEYRIVQQTFTIAANSKTRLKVPVPRWDDLPASRWYSGDAHIHLARRRSENRLISSFLRAEDIHVSNILEMNNPGAAHFRQYAWGTKGQFRLGHHVMVPGIEGPRTAQRGHTISLNIQRPLYDRDQYFNYHKFFEEYARQGGLSGYAHVGSGEFRASWGLALDVPFGLVDFVEILQDGILRTELWYEFLNLGYELTPVAGSDFPYFDQPGAVRSYVKVEGNFTPAAWYQSLGAGRTFVTNGPMLAFTVNGQPMGSVLNVNRDDSLTIQASARINPDIDRLDRLELVVHGEVVKSVAALEKAETLTLNHKLTADSGSWIAVRSYGKKQAVSHTAPVYVHVGDGGSWSAEKMPGIVKKMRQRLKSLAETPILANRELEFWEVDTDLAALWNRQKPSLLERIAEAQKKYDDLLKRVHATAGD
ncbi:MAG: CehA/McbA family metallohydrolase [Acidobacteriota bacterium]